MEKDFRFDIAISFAGTERNTARLLAKALTAEGYSVFIDESFEHELLGEDGTLYLRRIYSCQSRICIVLISETYDQRAWANLEREAIQERELLGEHGVLLPVMTDSYRPQWLPKTRIYFDLTNRPLSELVHLLKAKLQRKSTRVFLRSQPIANLKIDSILSAVHRYDLLDKALNPYGNGILHKLEKIEVEGVKLVFDKTTSLMWQVHSSDRLFHFYFTRGQKSTPPGDNEEPKPEEKLMDRETALDYISYLNDCNYGGYDNWRLPTVEEGLSLVRPKDSELDSLYLDPYHFYETWMLTSDILEDSQGIAIDFYSGRAISKPISELKARVMAVRSTSSSSVR